MKTKLCSSRLVRVRDRAPVFARGFAEASKTGAASNRRYDAEQVPWLAGIRKMSVAKSAAMQSNALSVESFRESRKLSPTDF